jgi:hypothetical protein
MLKTVRLTLIFLLLTGLIYAVLFITYSTSAPTPNTTITTIILPIAAGLLATPFTLRLNRRWR